MSNLQRKVTACYGVECYLRKHGIKVTKKSVSNITADFLKSIGQPYTKFNPRYKGLFSADVCNAETVQEHFTKFCDYVKTLTPPQTDLTSKGLRDSKIPNPPQK